MWCLARAALQDARETRSCVFVGVFPRTLCSAVRSRSTPSQGHVVGGVVVTVRVISRRLVLRGREGWHRWPSVAIRALGA